MQHTVWRQARIIESKQRSPTEPPAASRCHVSAHAYCVEAAVPRGLGYRASKQCLSEMKSLGCSIMYATPVFALVEPLELATSYSSQPS